MRRKLVLFLPDEDVVVVEDAESDSEHPEQSRVSRNKTITTTVVITIFCGLLFCLREGEKTNEGKEERQMAAAAKSTQRDPITEHDGVIGEDKGSSSSSSERDETRPRESKQAATISRPE